jgi:hypothetical protein
MKYIRSGADPGTDMVHDYYNKLLFIFTSSIQEAVIQVTDKIIQIHPADSWKER